VTALPCLNCDTEVTSGDLYCSQLCKQTAGAVRYVRAVMADGRINDPEVQAAVQIKIASVLGGGYPERERRLSTDERLAIFERDRWGCQVCGAAAEEIDHIGNPETGLNEPANLQAICPRCHLEKTKEQHRPVHTVDERARALALKARFDAVEPIRECDRSDWQQRWRGLKKERRLEALAASSTLFKDR
jgi:5-methylcytosine-specific restriction endonuclease McrA